MIALLRKIGWWLRPGRKDRELREELQFHIDQEARERMEAGAAADARRDAARDLGNEARVREDVRAVWTWRPLDELTRGRPLRDALDGHASGAFAGGRLTRHRLPRLKLQPGART